MFEESIESLIYSQYFRWCLRTYIDVFLMYDMTFLQNISNTLEQTSSKAGVYKITHKKAKGMCVCVCVFWDEAW